MRNHWLKDWLNIKLSEYGPASLKTPMKLEDMGKREIKCLYDYMNRRNFSSMNQMTPDDWRRVRIGITSMHLGTASGFEDPKEKDNA